MIEVKSKEQLKKYRKFSYENDITITTYEIREDDKLCDVIILDRVFCESVYYSDNINLIANNATFLGDNTLNKVQCKELVFDNLYCDHVTAESCKGKLLVTKSLTIKEKIDCDKVFMNDYSNNPLTISHKYPNRVLISTLSDLSSYEKTDRGVLSYDFVDIDGRKLDVQFLFNLNLEKVMIERNENKMREQKPSATLTQFLTTRITANNIYGKNIICDKVECNIILCDEIMARQVDAKEIISKAIYIDSVKKDTSIMTK